MRSVIVLVALLAAVPGPVFALGTRIPNLDAEATARGNAFVATADNPSALYYNPAGITQLKGARVELDFHAITLDSHFKGEGGQDSHSKPELQGVPQLYYVFTPTDKPYSFGLGMYAPFGLGIQWPGNAPMRNQGIEGRLMYVTLGPIGAWEIVPGLSIAAGPTFNYSQLKLRTGVGLTPGDTFRFTGYDWAIGAKAGLRWQPHEKWAFGLSYFSPTTMDYQGGTTVRPEFEGKRPTKATFEFPQFIMAGISFRPTPHWNFEIGADWTDWDTVNTVTFEGTSLGNVAFPLNWKSSYMLNAGVSRYFDNHYWIAAGYFFSQNSTTDRDFNPLIPDNDLHVGSVGFGYKGERWSWALSGQIITGPPRHVNNGNGADGSYQFFNQAVNFSVAYRF